jgi:hypothetical protein
MNRSQSVDDAAQLGPMPRARNLSATKEGVVALEHFARGVDWRHVVGLLPHPTHGHP